MLRLKTSSIYQHCDGGVVVIITFLSTTTTTTTTTTNNNNIRRQGLGWGKKCMRCFKLAFVCGIAVHQY